VSFAWPRRSGSRAAHDAREGSARIEPIPARGYMHYFSEEFKRSMVAKMSVPGGRSSNSLCREVGISQSTLSLRLRERITLGSNGEIMKQRRPSVSDIHPRLRAVLGVPIFGELAITGGFELKMNIANGITSTSTTYLPALIFGMQI